MLFQQGDSRFQAGQLHQTQLKGRFPLRLGCKALEDCLLKTHSPRRHVVALNKQTMLMGLHPPLDVVRWKIYLEG